MSYSESEARKMVLQAGLDLVEQELIARTWGNISARIEDGYFIVTPSGRSYDSLTEEDLVKVKIDDCSYEGNIKPSSEKGIHAAIYKERPDCNFIIHTHQNYATAISVDDGPNGFAPVVKYALPGTKKLKKNVVKALSKYPTNVEFILERHGVFCIGNDCNDAFLIAIQLENKARTYFEKNVSSKLEVPQEEYKKPYLDDYAQMFGYNPDKPLEEDKKAIELIINKNILAVVFAHYKSHRKPMCRFDVALQHFVYKQKYSKLKNKK